MLQSRKEAALKREKALAYAFSHQVLSSSCTDTKLLFLKSNLPFDSTDVEANSSISLRPI